MAEKDVSMAEKCQTFNSFVSRTPMITLDKLTESENYQSWANSADLQFIGNGCCQRWRLQLSKMEAPIIKDGGFKLSIIWPPTLHFFFLVR